MASVGSLTVAEGGIIPFDHQHRTRSPAGKMPAIDMGSTGEGTSLRNPWFNQSEEPEEIPYPPIVLASALQHEVVAVSESSAAQKVLGQTLILILTLTGPFLRLVGLQPG